MKDRFFKMLNLGIKQFSDPYYQGFAGQIAFYFMLSIVPVVLLISQLVGYFLGTTLDDAVGWILENSGGTVGSTLKRLLTYKSVGLFNFVYIFIALWAGSRAQFCMMRINNFMFSEGQTTGKGYWRERFRAVFNLFVTLITIIFALFILTYGSRVLKYFTDGTNVWLWLRWPLAFILFFIMIVFNYYFMPETRVELRNIVPGSIFAAIGLLLVTALYSKYTASIAKYDIIYGSLATIVALMFWFYFMAWVICLGILFNKVWMDTK